MENYNQSDSTQRWVMEYNANPVVIISGSRFEGILHRNIFGIVEEAFWTSRVTKEGRDSVEVIFSRQNSLGNIFL